jgi:hypothetical protein
MIYNSKSFNFLRHLKSYQTRSFFEIIKRKTTSKFHPYKSKLYLDYSPIKIQSFKNQRIM